MSTSNNNVGKFHQQYASENDGVTKHLHQHNVWLKCVHCGRHQSVTVLVPSNTTTDVTESKPTGVVSFRDFDSHRQTPPHSDVQQTNDSFKLLRFAPVIDETNDAQSDITPALHRSDYAHQFVRFRDDENDRKVALERNINGFVGECVRSTIHEVSLANRENETEEYLEVEFDSVLGNVTATRKRSSTIVTNLDNDHPKTRHRPQSLNTRYEPRPPPTPPINTEQDNQPIWARRRLSHSTVKPSDLVREHDKKDKLQATALRRLSRADLAGDDVVPNSTRPYDPATIKDTILRWCQDCTQFYRGVNIRNFSSSWSDGLAFCALIHRFFPDEFNFETLRSNEPKQNFDLAFTVALERAGIEPLIDTDDMLFMGSKPDWKVVFTYVQSIYRRLSRVQPPAIMRERWLN